MHGTIVNRVELYVLLLSSPKQIARLVEVSVETIHQMLVEKAGTRDHSEVLTIKYGNSSPHYCVVSVGMSWCWCKRTISSCWGYWCCLAWALAGAKVSIGMSRYGCNRTISSLAWTLMVHKYVECMNACHRTRHHLALTHLCPPVHIWTCNGMMPHHMAIFRSQRLANMAPKFNAYVAWWKTAGP